MGRKFSGRPTCEMCPSIDARVWQREGLLQPGRSFPYSWTQEGQQYGCISVRIDHRAAHLSFSAYIPEVEEWKSFEQRIPVVGTACPFGGGRPWFLCTATANGQYCGRRVAKLYIAADPVFACRHCHGVTYASQLESLAHRGISKARKIRMNLGGGPNLLEPFPSRPKGIHLRTYLRMRGLYKNALVRCGQR